MGVSCVVFDVLLLISGVLWIATLSCRHPQGSGAAAGIAAPLGYAAGDSGCCRMPAATDWSPAAPPARPRTAGSTPGIPAPASPPDFSPRNRSAWPAANVNVIKH